MSVGPSSFTLVVDGTQSLTVTAHYDDNTQGVVTTGVGYESMAPATATVSPAGLVTGVAVGSTTVTATFGGKSGTAFVTVNAVGEDTLTVFADDYGAGVGFAPFAGTTNDMTIDTTEKHSGNASLKIVVPSADFTGGALKIDFGVDVSTFDALTFWAKSSKSTLLDTVGIGNDTVGVTYQAEVLGLPLTSTWTKFVVPLPLPSKLTSLTGLFHFAEGSNEGAYTIWMDDIQFEKLGGTVLGPPNPAIASAALTQVIGDTFSITGGTVTFAIGTASRTVNVKPGYFTFNSSNTDVATVDSAGLVSVVGSGTTNITAKLASVDASGTVAVTVAGAPTGMSIFADDYATGVSFVAFDGSANDLVVDGTEKHSGAASLRIGVPAAGYTGGAMKIATPANLTAFDAVTFWARASKAATLNVTGLGNDGPSKPWSAEWRDVALTTTWTKYVVPIPLAAKLTAVGGVFHFAEGSDEGAYTIWLDDIQYEQLGSGVIGAPHPAIPTDTFDKQVGDTVPIIGLAVTFPVNGTDQTLVEVAPSYFTFHSSDPDVATVDANGVISAVGVGSAAITASLGSVDAAGTTTINVAAATVPTVAAPTPTLLAANVISLFSGPYTNVVVDTWRTDWSMAVLTDLDIAGNPTKKYTNDVFAGVEFFHTATINATTMTHFHLDIWTPDSTQVRVKLVDFGGDSLPGGTAANADSEAEVTFDGGSTPVLTTGTWMQLDIPIATFKVVNPDLKVANMAQLIISGSNSTIYVDNVYFHK